MSTPRGIRNNNPGNIRFNSANDWDGQIGKDSSGFAKFSGATLGIRALGKLLRNYQRLHGLITIQQIISRWAPPVNDDGEFENNTDAYIEHAALALQTSPAAPINLNDGVTLAAMVRAIIQHENGPVWEKFINDRTVQDGVNLALA